MHYFVLALLAKYPSVNFQQLCGTSNLVKYWFAQKHCHISIPPELLTVKEF